MSQLLAEGHKTLNSPVGVSSPLQDCSVSVWAEYTPVIFLVSVCLQIWGRLVITFWVKIDRDVGEFFNLKLLFTIFGKEIIFMTYSYISNFSV